MEIYILKKYVRSLQNPRFFADRSKSGILFCGKYRRRMFVGLP